MRALKRSYESWRLSFDRRAGLAAVPLERFERVVSGRASGSSAAAMFALGTGFAGEDPDVEYHRAAVTALGALVLIDPASAPATPSAAFAACFAATSSADSIRSTFTDRSLLVCPWFDVSQSSTATDFFDPSAPLEYVERASFGLDVGSERLYGRGVCADGGVLVARRFDAGDGRCDVVRWTVDERSLSERRFEARLYEDGRIVCAYDGQPIAEAHSPFFPSGAAVAGLFFPSGSRRFRDFVDPGSGSRPLCAAGGYSSDARWSDGGVPYASHLARGAWLGGLEGRCAVTLEPPRSLRRGGVRGELDAIDATARRAPRTPAYDDRWSLPATGSLSEAPASCEWAAASHAGYLHPDLFSGDLARSGALLGSLELVRSDRRTAGARPFDDAASWESTLDFASGSTLAGAIDRIASRDSVSLSLRVDVPTRLLETGSQALVYHAGERRFVVMGRDRNAGPGIWLGGDLADGRSWSKRIAEDFRGFGAFGQWCASGTLAGAAAQSTGVPGWHDASRAHSLGALLSARHARSVTLSDDYFVRERATGASVAFPGDAPFVVEAIEARVPFAAGAGWLDDVSSVSVPEPASSSAGWDAGGPAITVWIGVERGSPLVRWVDVVASGTFTNSSDAASVPWRSTTAGAVATVTPLGLRACCGDAAGIVSGTAGAFSGSVSLQMLAATSAGAVYALSGNATPLNFLATLPAEAEIPRPGGTSWGWLESSPAHLTPFGRAHSGLPADRAVESAISIPEKPSHRLTLTGSALAALSGAVELASTVQFVGVASNVRSKLSPYVLQPGDRIYVAASKARPTMLNSPVLFSGSHDASFAAGELRVKFIGRSLGAQRSVAVDGSLSLATRDEHELSSRLERYGTSRDDWVSGSYLTSVGSSQRGRVFSVSNASASNSLDSSAWSTFVTRPSTRAGVTSFSTAVSSDERSYDSLVPRIDEIVRADGASVLLQRSTFYLSGQSAAILSFDVPPEVTSSIEPYTDYTWSKAYPFEPRYSHLTRYAENVTVVFCDHALVGPTFGAVTALTERASRSLVVPVYRPWTRPRETAPAPTTPNLYFAYHVDAQSADPPAVITAPVTTVVARPDDLLRGLFGTGDANTITGSSRGFVGTTNGPEYVSYANDPASSKQYTMMTKPIARGWRYGLASALPISSRATWRAGRYGQLRDMLEQRADTKFYYRHVGEFPVVGPSPIAVRWSDPSTGASVSASSTQSSNLSAEATSSLPYFDGAVRNR